MSYRQHADFGPTPFLKSTAKVCRYVNGFRTKLAVLLLAGLIPFSAAAQQAPEDHAAAIASIKTLNAALLDAMKSAETVGYNGRYQKLEPVLLKTYDFGAMAKASLGGTSGYWGKLTDAQHKTLIDAFGRMSIATYAFRFDGYNGQRFEMNGAQKGPRETVLVRSRIVSKSGEGVKLNYLMIERPSGWKIIDVFAKGSISEIATKRSDYGAIMKNEGFDSLITRLKSKVAQYEKP